MARGRMLSKSLSASEKRATLQLHFGLPCPQCGGTLGEFAQTLYMLLVAHADDWGRQAGGVMTVRHLIDPSSLRSLDDFERALTALHDVGLIQWYRDAQQRPVIAIVDFEAHQSGLHKRTESKFAAQAIQGDSFPTIPASSGGFPTIPESTRTTELNRTELNRTKEGKNAPTRARASRNGKPSVKHLTAMVAKSLLSLGLSPDDLTEAAKAEAAARHLPYDSRSIAKAIACATALAHKGVHA